MLTPFVTAQHFVFGFNQITIEGSKINFSLSMKSVNLPTKTCVVSQKMSSIHCVAWVETGMRVRGGAEERWEGRGKLVGVRRSGRGEYSSGLAHGDTQGGCGLSSCPVMLEQRG